MAGKHPYRYHSYSGHRRGSGPSDGLFGWTVFMFLLIGFVFLCWMGSYYIFAHPEQAANYRLLTRLHKLDPPQRFEITAAPRGEFLKPGQLLERFGSLTAPEIRRTNETLLRGFVCNYHQSRDLVPYAVGTYRVIGSRSLSSRSFCPSGLVALLQAVEQPEVVLEQLFTADENNIPALRNSLTPGQEIKLEKPLDLSAVVHIDRLPDNRIRLTTMPLLYGSYGAVRGQTSFSLEPPEGLNMEAGLPVLSADEIGELSGGRIARSDHSSGRLARIPEESSPTPEPRIAKAIPSKLATKKPATSQDTATADNEPVVARAIPVDAQPILPAIPVKTPVLKQEAPKAMVPKAVSVETASAPVATPTPSTHAFTQPLIPPSVAVPPPSGTLPNAPAVLSTNSAVVPPPPEVWPVYTPGQMPRGRLLDASDVDNLAGNGLGRERHYLEGRFSVTASGNGRAVLRPQGVLAGVPMGPSSRVRVIVEFPAGSIPPSEGNTISRDNLRPFQITSIKRGEDGQINVYAREVTKGQ